MAGEAAHRTADQEAGGAIIRLAAITAIIVAPDAGVAIDALVTRIMAAVLALAIEVRRLFELVIARRLGGGRHAGVERRGAEDAGGDERAHQAFGENTHYKSFPGSAIPSLVEIGDRKSTRLNSSH